MSLEVRTTEPKDRDDALSARCKARHATIAPNNGTATRDMKKLAMLMIVAVAALTGCRLTQARSDAARLKRFASDYTAAWCSQDPVKVAACYATNGSLKINDSAPWVGRDAITEVAGGFMATFPDMVVKMDGVELDGGHAVYRWTLIGTNTGPGGTGRLVHISGYEEWTLDSDGLIAESKGHFDEADYQRQLSGAGD